MHLNKLEEELKDLRIPLQEDDVLDLLQIRKRWPLKYPWGQYGVEILNSNGILVFPFTVTMVTLSMKNGRSIMTTVL